MTRCGRHLPRNLLWGPIRVQFWLWWRRPAKVPEIYNVYLYTTTIAFVILCPADRGPHIAEIVNKANVLLYCRRIINKYTLYSFVVLLKNRTIIQTMNEMNTFANNAFFLVQLYKLKHNITVDNNSIVLCSFIQTPTLITPSYKMLF
ncbi:Uncharacterized protein FWK35_00003959, partial [Aphis craccivora]